MSKKSRFDNDSSKVKRHSQENEIIEFLEAVKGFGGKIKLDGCSEITDTKVFAQKQIDVIKSYPSRRQYNLAILHTKYVKNEIA